MTTQPPAGDAEHTITRESLDRTFTIAQLSSEIGLQQILCRDAKLSLSQSRVIAHSIAEWIADYIVSDRKAQREALTNQLNAKADQLDKIIDNYSIHAARGYPKGTLARRGLKKRIRTALHQLKDPERS